METHNCGDASWPIRSFYDSTLTEKMILVVHKPKRHWNLIQINFVKNLLNNKLLVFRKCAEQIRGIETNEKKKFFSVSLQHGIRADCWDYCWVWYKKGITVFVSDACCGRWNKDCSQLDTTFAQRVCVSQFQQPNNSITQNDLQKKIKNTHTT